MQLIQVDTISAKKNISNWITIKIIFYRFFFRKIWQNPEKRLLQQQKIVRMVFFLLVFWKHTDNNFQNPKKINKMKLNNEKKKKPKITTEIIWKSETQHYTQRRNSLHERYGVRRKKWRRMKFHCQGLLNL